MEELIERIKLEGKVIGDDILKVDSFLNHRVDSILLKKIGERFARIFESERVSLVLTVESSGIPPALFTAFYLNVPLIFARKKRPITLDGRVFERKIVSRTKLNEVTISLSEEYIKEGERVLIIDDFLATGETIKALCEMVEEAKGKVVGIGVCIEKVFQRGRETLKGYKVESLAKVESLNPLIIRP
ncbi:MAG: xanthine phosphoribosyltransferase [Synergistetes bacterium]|nr:xanthine phosphoribosyltransferase [Synergistota bacterium]MDW8192338.1 xanthine phosphoribosyltransferase [Synergistota bacterium]